MAHLLYGAAHDSTDAMNPITPVGAALLLRIGRADLAERVAVASVDSFKGLGFRLVSDLIWFRLNRAVHAFQRREDEVSLQDTGWLIEHRALEPIPHRAFEYARTPMTNNYQALHADLLRRAQAGTRPAFDPILIKGLPFTDRVATITRYLDEVQPTIRMFPGGPMWRSDPIYRVATDIGEPLVETLLDCAENDDRLTRTVGTMDAARVLTFVPVRRVAELLVQDILGVSGANPDLNSLKLLWQSTKSLTMPERLMYVLEDDRASRKQWLDAARKLTEAKSVFMRHRTVPNGTPGSNRVLPEMIGEALRKRQNPSLTELMGKRLEHVTPIEPTASSQLESAVQMAEYLAKWDVVGGRSTFKTLHDRISQSISRFGRNAPDETKSTTEDMLATITRYRILGGDESAISDYESWIYTSEPPANFRSNARLSPLIERPDWGESVAKRLFLGDGAKWDLRIQLRRGSIYPALQLLGTRLLVFQAVRENLIEALVDETVIGQCWRESRDTDRYSLIRHPEGSNSFWGIKAPDRRNPRMNVKVPLRVCDVIGVWLGQFDGAPVFHPSWSLKDKDLALPTLIQYVRSSGAALVDLRPSYAKTE